jgi:hypothetical protein
LVDHFPAHALVQSRHRCAADAASFGEYSSDCQILIAQLLVFGSFAGLLNLVIFLLLVTLIASLVAVQLLRGDLPEGDTMTFSQTYNSFLGMYQVPHSLKRLDGLD